MGVLGVSKRVADDLPHPYPAHDPWCRGRLEIKQQRAGDDISVGATERTGQRKRRPKRQRLGDAQVGMIAGDRRRGREDIIDVAGAEQAPCAM